MCAWENEVAMSFDRRDIRPAMDVYTCDNVYLGTILKTIQGPAMLASDPMPDHVNEASAVSGELLGPVPTQPIGNPGPSTQSARTRYAVWSDSAQPLGRGMIVVGRWWGLVGRRTFPLEAVQAISMERVILRLSKDDLVKKL